jgi:stage III sporulation protein AB
MIIFVSVSIGRLLAAELDKRCYLLHDLQQGLLALEREISYTKTPLPQALKTAAEAGGRSAVVFHYTVDLLNRRQGISAQRAWELALEKASHELPLKAEDLFILNSFGRGLGLSNAEDQVKRLELSRQRLFQAEELAKDQARRLGKVWKNLGWAAGIAIAIISF